MSHRRATDEYELYDLTVDPTEIRNLAHPEHSDEGSRALLMRMKRILGEQLTKKRLVPHTGAAPGYVPLEVTAASSVLT